MDQLLAVHAGEIKGMHAGERNEEVINCTGEKIKGVHACMQGQEWKDVNFFSPPIAA